MTPQTGTLTCSACVAAYPEVVRWFREAGFSDLYVAGEPICIRGLKVSAP